MIFIGCVVLIFIAIGKVNAEKTLVEDYAKYGKEVGISSSVSGNAASGEGISGILPNISGDTMGLGSINIPIFQKYPELTKYALIFGTAILFVVFITSFAAMLGAKKEEKKKK